MFTLSFSCYIFKHATDQASDQASDQIKQASDQESIRLSIRSNKAIKRASDQASDQIKQASDQESIRSNKQANVIYYHGPINIWNPNKYCDSVVGFKNQSRIISLLGECRTLWGEREQPVEYTVLNCCMDLSLYNSSVLY